MKVNYQKSVESKYQAILLRSYKTKLDVYLFTQCIIKGKLDNVNELEFKNFKISDVHLEMYKDAWSLPNEESLSSSNLPMRQIDGMIENFYKGEYYKEKKETFFNIYKDDFANTLSIESLKTIYKEEPDSRRCEYCGISENDIAQLKKDKKIETKRLRGDSLEFDRKDAYKEYEKDNLVLACYWCNNAKTDEFSYSEFINNVGPAFKKIWQERKNSIQ